MKRYSIALVPVALLLALAGCGGSPLTSGRITGKTYDPGHYWTYLMPQYRQQCMEIPSGNGGETEDCYPVVSYYLPVQEWAPPSWSLDLRRGKRTGSVGVSQASYDRAHIGQKWSAP